MFEERAIWPGKATVAIINLNFYALSLSRHFQYINYSSSNYLELLEMSIGDTETSISSFLRLVTMFAIATTDYNS